MREGAQLPNVTALAARMEAEMTTSPRRLRLHPDPVLRVRAEPITAFDASLRGLVDDLTRLMDEHKGVGMAAPQIGESVRVFVCNAREEGEETRVFINPEIVAADGALEWDDEGCLSLPGIQGAVRRPTRVQIKAYDLDGTVFEATSEDFHARIWQHEFDHLEGVLILDRMRPLDRLANRRAIKALVAEGGG